LFGFKESKGNLMTIGGSNANTRRWSVIRILLHRGPWTNPPN